MSRAVLSRRMNRFNFGSAGNLAGLCHANKGRNGAKLACQPSTL
jgi:hypothetical protein